MKTISHPAPPQDIARPPSSVPAYTRHAHARLAVLWALRTCPLVPSEAERERREDELAHAEGGRRDELVALVRAAEARFASDPCAATFLARQRDHLEAHDHTVLPYLRRRALCGAPDAFAARHHPYRREGAPWVWTADILAALPAWPSRHVYAAVDRLSAEGVVDLQVPYGERREARHAVAVRLSAVACPAREYGALAETLPALAPAVAAYAALPLRDEATHG